MNDVDTFRMNVGQGIIRGGEEKEEASVCRKKFTIKIKNI